MKNCPIPFHNGSVICCAITPVIMIYLCLMFIAEPHHLLTIKKLAHFPKKGVYNLTTWTLKKTPEMLSYTRDLLVLQRVI